MSIQVQLRRDTYANIMAAAAGAAGEVYVDTTNQRLVVNNGSVIGGFPSPVALFVGNTGDTNNSNAGSGSDHDHTPTFTIPANFMTAGRAVRVTAHYQINTGSAPPTLIQKIKLGSTVVGANLAATPSANLTNIQLMFQWIFQATAAPGASVGVQCAVITQLVAGSTANTSNTAQPVAIATNAAQTVKMTTLWATAGTGTNTIALNQFILEALN